MIVFFGIKTKLNEVNRKFFSSKLRKITHEFLCRAVIFKYLEKRGFFAVLGTD